MAVSRNNPTFHQSQKTLSAKKRTRDKMINLGTSMFLSNCHKLKQKHYLWRYYKSFNQWNFETL